MRLQRHGYTKIKRCYESGNGGVVRDHATTTQEIHYKELQEWEEFSELVLPKLLHSHNSPTLDFLLIKATNINEPKNCSVPRQRDAAIVNSSPLRNR